MIRFLWVSYRPHRGRILWILLFQAVQATALLLLPTLNALIIDNGLVKGDIDYVGRIGALMFGANFLQLGAAIAAERIGAGVVAALGRELRAAVFAKVLSFSAREVGEFGAASLITRTVNDVKQVQAFSAMGFDSALSAVAMSVGGLVLAIAQDVRLGLLLALTLLLIGGFVKAMLNRLDVTFNQLQEGVDRVNQVVREQVAGVRVVRAFRQDRREGERFTAANHEVYRSSLRSGRLTAVIPAVVLMLFNAFMIALIWFGGGMVDTGSLRLGLLLALLGYLVLIVTALMTTIVMLSSAARASVSVERIQEVLATSVSVRDPEVVRSARPSGQIELRGVEFGFPGAERRVLSGVDLVVGSGETVAIVGATGSGKSTVLDLVLRRFDVSRGAVLVDGVDVRDVGADRLGEIVGFVPQTAYLFSGTVRSNLHFGRPTATDDDLWHALDVVQARDFVAAMPEGLDGRVEQGGRNLSGGQRQRLSIARALLRRSEIYLFDDCFSALDAETDARLRHALRGELAGSTVLVVSQRVAAIRDADRIVVLDEGKVAGVGPHDSLLRDNDVYRQIVESQPTSQEETDAAVSRH